MEKFVGSLRFCIVGCRVFVTTRKVLIVGLLLWLLPVPSLSQFKILAWYESWCEQPLGQNGYGIPPWQLNWQGIDVIVHFDNENIADNVAPYWGYINKGNSGVDSLYFFFGANAPYDNPKKGYQDSLVRRGHAVGAVVVVEMQCVEGSHLFNITADSVKTDVLCTAVAQWCERHNYDGVDVNWENNFQTTANGTRFIRILRKRLNQYLTTPHVVSRPWISLTCPPGVYSSNGMFPLSIKDSVDMICPQQGTAQWVGGTDCGGLSHVSWYGAAVRVGTTTQSQAHGAWLSSLSEDASWIPAQNRPQDGIRKINSVYGWPKSMIAPAFCAGGGSIYVGVDTILACFNGYGSLNDRARYAQKPLLQNGGHRGWDAVHQASYIAGTATADMPWPTGLTNGQKFFAPTPDSTQDYYATRWLVDNGWGGVAPYSIQFDVDPSASINNRLPGHKGLIAAKGPPAPSAPTATTGAATGITQTTVTLNGAVNGNGANTTVRFVYGTAAGTYTDSVIAQQSPVIGNTPVSGGIAGLTASRTYYFRVRASSILGNAQGSEASFTTSATTAPTVTTGAATAITYSRATLNGTVNANGAGTTVRFVWGTAAGTYTDSALAAESPVTGSSLTPVTCRISGLAESATYYCRVRAYNSRGNTQGVERSFTTTSRIPILLAPVNGQAIVMVSNPTVIDFAWSVVVTASSYLLQIATDQSFTGLILTGAALTNDLIEPLVLIPGQSYYWRVAAIDSLGQGPFSSVAYFLGRAATDTVRIPISRGWNMVSLPISRQERRGTVVFPNATSSMYLFDDSTGFAQRDTLEYGRGYWLRFPAREDVVVPGIFRNSDSIIVRQGWNLVGTISDSTPVSTIIQSPSGILLSSFLAGFPSAPEDTLVPGHAYWVKVSRDGWLIYRRILPDRP